jgi:hypothetical protein
MKQMDAALDPMAGCAFHEGYAKQPMGVFAIDPGPVISGWCVLLDGKVIAADVYENERLLKLLENGCAGVLAIEMIASYGMPVGREVFETCVWIGRFFQAWKGSPVELVYRKDVKMHLCGSMKAKDANIRQALIDLFPATGGGKIPQIGTKAKPGPLCGVSTHVWPALAVAVTVAGKQKSHGDCTVLGE